MHTFASDNNSGVHPLIMEAIIKANQGHVKGYGEDIYTARAQENFKLLFGAGVEVFFVFTGTASNVLGLKAMTQPYQSILCADTAHIQTDECGAPERFTGSKLIPIPTPDGKLTPNLIKPHLHGINFVHHSQPKVVSITQSTELGTVYTVDQIKELSDFVHQQGLFLHVDGARIANAAVSLGCSFRNLITETGVDVLSFGGTKNGMMFGEAIVFLNPVLSENFGYTRKQGMQLASKMRFISAQFNAYLENDLWRINAGQSNQMAKLLSGEVKKLGIQVTHETEANSVYAILPQAVIPALQQESFFYVWDESTSEVRWVCSWNTCEEDVYNFTGRLRSYLS
ncbi:MAG: low specificity L-threonine aldolase [Bacteroidales bacterium]|nr:low specificity L-threonine aldolase [Bacteroidales bacterium]